jgi:hypothetical protein
MIATVLAWISEPDPHVSMRTVPRRFYRGKHRAPRSARRAVTG